MGEMIYPRFPVLSVTEVWLHDFNPRQLHKAQLEDPDLALIIHWLETDQTPAIQESSGMVQSTKNMKNLLHDMLMFSTIMKTIQAY